jgi:hypothetical protein
LNVVDRCLDEAALLSEIFSSSSNCLNNIFCCSERKHVLRIYSTPEREVFAKVSVQLFRLHAGYADLPGVDYIDPDVDEVGDQLSYRTVALGDYFGVGVFVQCFDKSPVMRFNHFL